MGLLSIIPNDWKWNIAIKKIGYSLAKLAVAGLAYAKAQVIMSKLGINVDPKAFQDGTAAAVIAALEGFHDWAKLKWPDASWL